MEHILYWLWLTTKYGVTPSKIKVLLEYFKTVEEIYFSKNFNNIYGLSDKIKSSLADKDLSKAEKILEQTAKLNQKILVYDSESYPQILKNISSPPYVLYVQGKVLELDKVLTIGVVGTRNSSEYGRVVTDRICRELAQYGVVTVGGLARGIDTVGAWATLDVGGVAVGVVGSGLDIVYPSENVELVKAITEKGCIISEYAPGTPPVRNHFPARNRIYSRTVARNTRNGSTGKERRAYNEQNMHLKMTEMYLRYREILQIQIPWERTKSFNRVQN